MDVRLGALKKFNKRGSPAAGMKFMKRTEGVTVSGWVKSETITLELEVRLIIKKKNPVLHTKLDGKYS